MDDKFSLFQQLANLFAGGQAKPSPEMLGSGMAARAGQNLKWSDAYRQYAIDAQTNGEPVLSMPEFQQRMMMAMDKQQGKPAATQNPAMFNRGLGY